MVKFYEIGTYKNAVNIGYCVATVEMHNGQVAEYEIAKKTAKHPTDGKKAGLALVMNAIEKPDVSNPNKYVIEEGEFPRMFTLESLKDRILEMDMDQVQGNYTDIEVGDKLVPTTDGDWKEESDVSQYPAYLEVTEKTPFNGEGLRVIVRIATPAAGE